MGEEETKRVDEQEESADFCDEKNEDKADSCEVGETREKPDRDVALAQIEMEKKLTLVKAWEDNEKTKADNKAHKKLSAIDAWEKSKRASVEAQLKEIEEKFEKKKAEYAEKMKNKVGGVYKAGEEKRAKIEGGRGKEFVMVEEFCSQISCKGQSTLKIVCML